MCHSCDPMHLHVLPNSEGAVNPYENQVDTITRFSLDSGIRCGNWISWEAAGGAEAAKQTSSSICDKELIATWDEARGLVLPEGPSSCQQPITVHHFSDPVWSDIPPLRVMSIGIERSPTTIPPSRWVEGECPDPIRAISLILTNTNGGTIFSKSRVILINSEGLDALRGDDDSLRRYGNWSTRVFPNEAEVLKVSSRKNRESPSSCELIKLIQRHTIHKKQAFQDLVLQEDPSILTGFEVGEGLRVLLSRAAALKLKTFGTLSRRRNQKIVVKTMQMYSAKWAKQSNRGVSTASNQEGTEVSLLLLLLSLFFFFSIHTGRIAELTSRTMLCLTRRCAVLVVLL